SNGMWVVDASSSATGLVGVNYSAKLMALKIICLTDPVDPTGKPYGTVGLAIEAINYARKHGAMVLNNSWGVGGAPEDHLQILKGVIMRTNCELEEANNPECKPALFVASAGNNQLDNDTNPHYPSNFTDVNNVIAVAASNRGDALWVDACQLAKCNGSNWGVTTVHLAEPGAFIRSTSLPDQENGATVSNGTSFAAPHVSGCAALLQAKRLSTSSTPILPKDLRHILMTTGDQAPLDPQGKSLLARIKSARRLNCAA